MKQKGILNKKIPDTDVRNSVGNYNNVVIMLYAIATTSTVPNAGPASATGANDQAMNGDAPTSNCTIIGFSDMFFI
jgi:hypothetical protein